MNIDKCRELAIAIIEQGVEDVYQGDPGAIAWLDGPDFDHWCAWVDINPEAARQSIHARRRVIREKYSMDKIRHVIRLHNTGLPWIAAITSVFGYYSETIRNTVMRYAQAA